MEREQVTDPKKAYGQDKAQLHLLPTSGLVAAAGALSLGGSKYGYWNWRGTTVAPSTYVGAAMRHLLAWRDGEDIDPESGVSHLGHVMANCAIILDAIEHGTLVDDRPKKVVDDPERVG
jgi:hypothetical protein